MSWRALGRAAVLCACAGAAFAHGPADWISKGGYRNAAGEQCCGENDCHEIAGAHVSVTPAGYLVDVPGYPSPHGLGLIGAIKETVPFSEALPSPDGKFWRCEWGGKRRCFFAPPPST